MKNLNMDRNENPSSQSELSRLWSCDWLKSREVRDPSAKKERTKSKTHLNVCDRFNIILEFLSSDFSSQLTKKVNNVESSWALGAALDFFHHLTIHWGGAEHQRRSADLRERHPAHSQSPAHCQSLKWNELFDLVMKCCRCNLLINKCECKTDLNFVSL